MPCLIESMSRCATPKVTAAHASGNNQRNNRGRYHPSRSKHKTKLSRYKLKGRIHKNGTGATSYPTIYVDGLLYGDITTLKSLDAAQIGEVRMYQAWEAQTKFGMGNNGGVIAISSRR